MADGNEEYLDIKPDVRSLFDNLNGINPNKQIALYHLILAKKYIFENTPLPDVFPEGMIDEVNSLKDKIVSWLNGGTDGPISNNDFKGMMEEFAGNFQSEIDAIKHDYDLRGGRRRNRKSKHRRSRRRLSRRRK